VKGLNRIKLVRHIHSLIERLRNIIKAHDPEAINIVLYSLYANVKTLSEEILCQETPSYEKEKIIRIINNDCLEVTRLLTMILRNVRPINLYTLIDLIGELYKSGCIGIVDATHKNIIRALNKNPDGLAHFADMLMDCGCVDLAIPVLLRLLRYGYNVPIVLMNLSIATYMLGEPREALKFAMMYRRITGKRMALEKPLRIVLGEI